MKWVRAPVPWGRRDGVRGRGCRAVGGTPREHLGGDGRADGGPRLCGPGRDGRHVQDEIDVERGALAGVQGGERVVGGLCDGGIDGRAGGGGHPELERRERAVDGVGRVVHRAPHDGEGAGGAGRPELLGGGPDAVVEGDRFERDAVPVEHAAGRDGAVFQCLDAEGGVAAHRCVSWG